MSAGPGLLRGHRVGAERRRLGLILVLVLASSLPGCMGPVKTGHFLVLEYTATRTDNETHFVVEPGQHCRGSELRGARVAVDSYEARGLGDGTALFVDPDMVGAWSSQGDEPFVAPLPHAADLRFLGEPGDPGQGAWAFIEGQYDDGTWEVAVDNVTVDLPHSWTFEGPGFTIEAGLRDGPDSYRVLPEVPCE